MGRYLDVEKMYWKGISLSKKKVTCTLALRWRERIDDINWHWQWLYDIESEFLPHADTCHIPKSKIFILVDPLSNGGLSWYFFDGYIVKTSAWKS